MVFEKEMAKALVELIEADHRYADLLKPVEEEEAYVWVCDDCGGMSRSPQTWKNACGSARQHATRNGHKVYVLSEERFEDGIEDNNKKA